MGFNPYLILVMDFEAKPTVGAGRPPNDREGVLLRHEFGNERAGLATSSMFPYKPRQKTPSIPAMGLASKSIPSVRYSLKPMTGMGLALKPHSQYGIRLEYV